MPEIQRSRALLYVRGTAEQIDEQLATLGEVCTRRGYEMAGIVQDHPGQTRGYLDAHRMVRLGEADVIVFASASILPDVLESATGSLPGPRIRAALHRAARQRTRPIRREDGAA